MEQPRATPFKTLHDVYFTPSRPVMQNALVVLQPFVSLKSMETGAVLGSMVDFYADRLPMYDHIVVAEEVRTARLVKHILNLGDLIDEITPDSLMQIEDVTSVIKAIDDLISTTGNVTPETLFTMRGYMVLIGTVAYAVLNGRREAVFNLNSLTIKVGDKFTANIIELSVSRRVLLALRPIPVLVAEERVERDSRKLWQYYVYMLPDSRRFMGLALKAARKILRGVMDVRVREAIAKLPRDLAPKIVGFAVAETMVEVPEKAVEAKVKQIADEAGLEIEDVAALIKQVTGAGGEGSSEEAAGSKSGGEGSSGEGSGGGESGKGA